MKVLKNLTKLALGFFAGYSLTQFAWVVKQFAHAEPQFTKRVSLNTAPKGISLVQGKTEPNYLIQYAVEGGIERISYFPKIPKFITPILMQHGMFHAAWCWEKWQILFAEWGWESHAISLPGHGNSPVQRLIKLCTLDYYLDFLRAAADKFERTPIFMGHSMGGALIQWYLKYIGLLPAAVFVAPWVYDSVLRDGSYRMLRRDPSLIFRMMLSWDASPWIRNPQRTGQLFLGPRANITADELHTRLDSESALVILQHNPPMWHPLEENETPTLWLAGEDDAGVSVAGLRKSAQHYQGEFMIIPEAGHNLMMEHNYVETAQTIHKWLCLQEIE